MNRRRTPTAIFALLLVLCILLLIFADSIQKRIYPLEYRDIIEAEAEKNGIEPELLSAVIYCESSFNPEAVSAAGAMGLMQLMPDTFDWLQRLMDGDYDGYEITDVQTNIACGAYYLGWLVRKFGDTSTALAAYNAGHGIVARWLGDESYSDDGVTLKNIPYAETEAFVAKVNKVKDTYKRLYFGQ